MKFEEYYQSSKSCLLPSEYAAGKIGWDACKKEVLKILNNEKNIIYYDSPQAYDLSIKEEIEKL